MDGEKDSIKKVTVIGASSDICRGLVQRAVMLTGQYFEPVIDGPWNTVTVRSTVFRYPEIDLFVSGSCGLAELMSHCTETQDVCILIVDGESLVPLHSLSWSRWMGAKWSRTSPETCSSDNRMLCLASQWRSLARQLQILLQTDSIGESMYPSSSDDRLLACPHLVVHYPNTSELSDWERGEIAGRIMPLLTSGLSVDSRHEHFEDVIRERRLHFVTGNDFRACTDFIFPELEDSGVASMVGQSKIK